MEYNFYRIVLWWIDMGLRLDHRPHGWPVASMITRHKLDMSAYGEADRTYLLLETNMSTYHYEVYTKHPQTNKTGWDIETGWVQATDIKEAKEKIIYSIDNFDCFIDIYEANMNINDILTIGE